MDTWGGGFPLTPAQWLPKPATSQFPHKRRTLRAMWSLKGEGEETRRFYSRDRFSNSWPGPAAKRQHQSNDDRDRSTDDHPDGLVGRRARQGLGDTRGQGMRSLNA